MNNTGSARSIYPPSARSRSFAAVTFGDCVKVKLLERLHPRQMGFADTPLDGVALPFLDHGRQQRLQISDVTFFSRMACSASVL